MAGEVEKPGMETVATATVPVALQHDGAHVVIKHLARRARRQPRVSSLLCAPGVISTLRRHYVCRLSAPKRGVRKSS
jgi:hypothetical protein